MSKTTINKPINLNVLGLLLIGNNDTATISSKKIRVFTANELANKIPKLKPLGNLPIIQIYQSNSGLAFRLPCVYTKDEKVVVTLPDMNASVTDDFTIEQWQAGDLNRAIIVHKDSGIALISSIAFRNIFLDHIRNDRNNHTQSDDVASLNIQWLKDCPAIELPLSTLPQGEVLTVIDGNDNRSREYNTKLVDIKSANGDIYRNVITNSSLRQLIADDIKQFKITDVKPVNLKDRSSTRRETRTIHKVLVEPVMSADFSSL